MMLDYSEAPSDEIFEDIKRCSIAIWMTYDDTYGYATGQISIITPIGNIRDNYGFMVGMFDYSNQHKLLELLQKDSANWLAPRMGMR